jgi:hypothetical protein
MIGTREVLAMLNSAETAAALERYYVLALQRILVELSRGVSRPGAARAVELMARIRDILANLNPSKQGAVREWIRQWVAKAFILGDQSASDGVQRDIKAVADGNARFGTVVSGWTAANQTALSAMVAAVDSTLKVVAAQMEAVLGLAVRRTQLVLHQDQAIRESVISGIIRGSSGRRLSDDIANIILKGGTPAELQALRAAGFQPDLLALYQRISQGQMVQAGNRTFDVRSYANLVARTMLSETVNRGAIVRLQQNDVHHVRISNPPRVGDPDVCTVFAGRVFYVGSGEDPLGFPALRSISNGGPPFHPHCRHGVQPFVVAIMTPAAINEALRDTRRIPGDYFNQTGSQVTKKVGSLDAAAINQIAPNARPPRGEEPPVTPKPAPGKEAA